MSLTATLTVIRFVLVGCYFAIRLTTDRGGYDRIFNIGHLLMSMMMIIMSAGWAARVPTVLQIIVFTALALWFVYLAMFRPAAVRNLTSSVSADEHHFGRPKLLYHAAMMLAMVWMAVMMAPVPPAGAADSSMQLDMSGHQHGDAGAASAPSRPWADPISITIGIAFAAATLWYLVRFIRLAGAPGPGAAGARQLTDATASAAMAAGMAVAFLWEMT